VSRLFSTPLLRFTLRRHAPAALLLWLVPVAIGLIGGLLYPAYAKERGNVRQFVDNLPFLKKLLDDDAVDFLSPAGFFNIAFRHPLTFLVFALTAALPSLTLPAADRGRGALDLLLAAPLARRALIRTVTAATVAFAIAVAFAPLLGVVGGAAVAECLDKVPTATYLVTSLNAAAFVLSLAGIALAIAAAAPDGAAAIARFAAVFVAVMLLDALSMLWKAGEWIRWLTPGGYYRAAEVAGGRANLPLCFGVLLGVAVVGVVLAERIADARRRA
jgi:hypothetical protein